MRNRIPQLFIAILIIIGICIAVNDYSDGVLRQGTYNSSLNEGSEGKSLIGEMVPIQGTNNSYLDEESEGKSLIGEMGSMVTFIIDPQKTTLKDFLYSAISAFITAIFFICIVLVCFVGLKIIFKQGRNNLPANIEGVTYRSGQHVTDLQTPDLSTAESKEPIVWHMPSSLKKCPSCGENHLKRIPRKWYMRLVPGSKRYHCRICRSKFTILFWRMII